MFSFRLTSFASLSAAPHLHNYRWPMCSQKFRSDATNVCHSFGIVMLGVFICVVFCVVLVGSSDAFSNEII